MGRRLSHETKIQASYLYQNTDRSPQSIADELGCSVTSVIRYGRDDERYKTLADKRRKKELEIQARARAQSENPEPHPVPSMWSPSMPGPMPGPMPGATERLIAKPPTPPEMPKDPKFSALTRDEFLEFIDETIAVLDRRAELVACTLELWNASHDWKLRLSKIHHDLYCLVAYLHEISCTYATETAPPPQPEAYYPEPPIPPKPSGPWPWPFAPPPSPGSAPECSMPPTPPPEDIDHD